MLIFDLPILDLRCAPVDKSTAFVEKNSSELDVLQSEIENALKLPVHEVVCNGLQGFRIA